MRADRIAERIRETVTVVALLAIFAGVGLGFAGWRWGGLMGCVAVMVLAAIAIDDDRHRAAQKRRWLAERHNHATEGPERAHGAPGREE